MKEPQDFTTLMKCLDTMKFIERRYFHGLNDPSNDIFDELFDGVMDRRGLDEEELMDEFKDDPSHFNLFLDDYLDVIVAFISYRHAMYRVVLGFEVHKELEATLVRFIIARYYGIHIQFENEYLIFRDNLSDEELNEFYACLNSRGIKVDGHTLVGVEFD